MRISLLKLPLFPPAVLVVPKRLPGRLIGLSLGPLIVIEQASATDHPTLIHELEHSRQFWCGGLVLHFLRYWLSRQYRLEAELRAFTLELSHCSIKEQGIRLPLSAGALASGYSLELTADQCQSLLTERLKELQSKTGLLDSSSGLATRGG